MATTFRDSSRFYAINGRSYPSVTTVLDVLNKPGLVYWAANLERKAFETALIDVLAKPGARDPEFVLTECVKALSGAKQAVKEKEKAAAIGSAAHAWIEWRIRRMLGQVEKEPVLPDAAAWAVEAWKDWAKSVDFKPLYVERTVYCESCGYAGTFDWIGEVRGIVTLGDNKTSKAIYPEMFLQSRAYRHAARRQGLETAQGLILRLPKTTDDPAFESQPVPDIPLDDFLAILRTWQCLRRLAGKPTDRSAA